MDILQQLTNLMGQGAAPQQAQPMQQGGAGGLEGYDGGTYKNSMSTELTAGTDIFPCPMFFRNPPDSIHLR